MAFPDKRWRFLTSFLLIYAAFKKITGGAYLAACLHIHLKQIIPHIPSVIRQNFHAVNVDTQKSFGIVVQFGKHLFIPVSYTHL